MSKLVLPLLAALVLFAPPAISAITTTVVDIPTPRGVTQRFLHIRPDSPKAIMVWMPGGNGDLGIQDNGAMLNGSCPAIPRNRLSFAERGFALAFVDPPSDFLIRQLIDVSEVIRHVRSVDNVPIWLVGGSMSTAAVASFAAALPESDPIGAIFHAPFVVTSDVGAIRRPTFVIYHAQDPFQVGSSFYASLQAAPAKQEEVMNGGDEQPCAGLTGFHTFQGLDNQFVAAVAGFIDKHNASLSPPPSPAAIDLNQHGLTGSWYEAATSGQGFEVEIFPDLAGPGRGVTQVSWFTFDHTAAGGPERQRWYTLQGNVATGTASAPLAIYQNVGGNFNAPPITAAQQVGTATLSFAACDQGQLDYTFNDGTSRTGSIPLTRLTQNVTCSSTTARPVNADFGFSGNWFDPATSGQGFTVEVNPISQAAFFAWYTYAPGGATAGAAGQRWYTGLSTTYTVGARSIPATLYETTGGRFDAPTPPQQATVAVGTATLAFQSCSAATLTFAFTGGSRAGASGVIALSRVGPVPSGCAM